MNPIVPTVGTNAAEKLVEKAIIQAQKKELPGRVIDPSVLISLIAGIIEAIRKCRSQSTATAHIKRGSATAVGVATKRLMQDGYKRAEARLLAQNLVKQGSELQDSEIQELVTESADVPVSNGNGFWPLILAFILCMASSPIQAFWPQQSNCWPVPTPTVESEKLSFSPVISRRDVQVQQSESQEPQHKERCANNRCYGPTLRRRR